MKPTSILDLVESGSGSRASGPFPGPIEGSNFPTRPLRFFLRRACPGLWIPVLGLCRWSFVAIVEYAIAALFVLVVSVSCTEDGVVVYSWLDGNWLFQSCEGAG